MDTKKTAYSIFENAVKVSIVANLVGTINNIGCYPELLTAVRGLSKASLEEVTKAVTLVQSYAASHITACTMEDYREQRERQEAMYALTHKTEKYEN